MLQNALRRLVGWWRLRRCQLCGSTDPKGTQVFSNNYMKYRLCVDDELECKRRSVLRLSRRRFRIIGGGK